MNKTLEISRYIYIFGLSLIPFFILPFSFTPFTLSKTFLLSGVIFLSFLFWGISKPKNLVFPNFFFLVLIFLEILSTNFNFEFFLFPRYSENYLITILLYFVVFLGINLFQKLNIEKIILMSSVPVVFSSLLDLVINPLRASGTLGQANFLSIYLVLVLLVLIFKYKSFKNYQIYLVGFLGILIFLIFKTASLTSFFSMLLGMYFLRKDLLQLDRKIISTLVIVLIIAFSLFGQIYKDKFKDIFNQIATQNNTIISDSLLIRLSLWEGVIKIITTSPQSIFLGFGSENFSYLFELNRPDKLNNLSEKYLVFDKPHNYFLEILFSYGIFHLSIFIFLIIRYFKYEKNYSYLLAPILIFIFFNWLDLFLKVLLFLILFSGENKVKLNEVKFFTLGSIVSLAMIFFYFSTLVFRDSSFYWGVNQYIFSNPKESITGLKTKSPVILLSSLKFLNEDERRKVTFFLIKNFPKNKAINFQLLQLN